MLMPCPHIGGQYKMSKPCLSIGGQCKMFVFNLCEETISRNDEGQPRPKYIFNKCGTNIYFFTLQRFGPSPSPNVKYKMSKPCPIIG